MADEFVVGKLHEWGLGSYVEDFKGKKIGQVAFKLLTEDNVKKLGLAYGDALVFNHYHGQMLEQNETFIIPIESVPSAQSTSSATLAVIVDNALDNAQPIPDLECEAIRVVIKSCGYGAAVLLLKRRLRERERKKICDIVVNHYLRGDPKERITPTKFDQWASVLSQIFQLDQQNLFYAPKQKTGSGIINASGALLRAYYGFRREFALMNDEDQEDSGNEEEVDNPPDSEDIQWLMRCLEPWDLVETKWELTRDTRVASFSSKTFSTHSYTDKFKVLRQPNGYLLVLSDFKAKYGEKSTALYDNISSFVDLVYEELKQVRPCPKELKTFLRNLDLSLSTGGELNTLSILLRLAFIVPSHSVLKKRMLGKEEVKAWRPSRQEVMNGFITAIDHVSKIQECVDRRDKRYCDLKLTRQPFVIVAGTEPDLQFYVSINDFLYKVNSLIEAVDVCFKSCFALNASFCLESRPLWMLLQTHVYGIYTNKDKRDATPSTISFLSKFNITLK